MIRASLLRVLLAGGLCLLSLALYSPGGDDALAGLVFLAGAAWGTIELLVLSALLFTYGGPAWIVWPQTAAGG